MRVLSRILCCLLGMGVALAAPEDPASSSSPTPTDIVERTETVLVQVDVSVAGPPEIVGSLTAEDFELKVNLKWVDDFVLDRLCEPQEEVAEEPSEGRAPDREAAAPPGSRAEPPTTYLFYLDQTHLTFAGRSRAIDVATRLTSELIRGGSRGMLVSSGDRLEVAQELTDDPEALATALKRVENDRGQWSLFAEEEVTRVEDVLDVLNDGDNVYRAIGRARTYQREELWRTDKSLRRLAMTLRRLADAPSPKVVLYFADTMRDNPGEHYVSIFGEDLDMSGAAASITADNLLAQHPFDLVVNEAVAQGIRFYTVLAQGLTNPQDSSVVSGYAVRLTGTVRSSSQLRVQHSQDTLANLASETGGRAYLRGGRATRISREIREDLSCLYLISFDPSRFSLDEPLRIKVRSPREDLTIRTRGRAIAQSESTRTSSALLAALLTDSHEAAEPGLQAHVVPSGFDDGAYSALLQISVPATTMASATWDVGASVIFREQVRDEVSARLGVGATGIPAVLEREIRLKPGEHEIVAIARETTSGFVLTERQQVVLPDPNDAPATCGPFAVLQPTPGAFRRAEATRPAGSLARGQEDSMSPGAPTALMGLVCRGRKTNGPFRVERTLVGATRVDFPELELDLEEERCAQLRDMVPADVLGPGAYRYEVRVLRDGKTLHEGAREFFVGGK